MEVDEEDDFFSDSWGDGAGDSTSSASKNPEARSSGNERNPTFETTTKRSTSPAVGGGSTSSSSSTPPPTKVGVKKDADLFAELGMAPEYMAPKVRTIDNKAGGSAPAAGANVGKSVSSLLDDAAAAEVGDGWGDEDLDLKL